VKLPIEHIRVSQQGRDQLIKLKRLTGIEHWNTLCRWAFCASLAEPTVPPNIKIPADSSIEMSWKIFGGVYQELYLGLLKERCLKDKVGIDDQTLAVQFRLHLHRGIGYLVTDRRIKNIRSFVEARALRKKAVKSGQ